MTLIIYYLVLVFGGTTLAVGVGLGIERYWAAASLPVFLSLYFAVLWVAWVLAVRLSEPRKTAAGAQAAEE